MALEEFIKDVKKVHKKRNHKVSSSLGVYDAYKYIRKNKWMSIGKPLTEHEFYSIIRKVSAYLAEELSLGNDIKLPRNMGSLQIRKTNTYVTLEEGKLKTNLPIDWDKTLKLWYESKEDLDKKTLVRLEEREVYKVFYNKYKADYNNRAFYEFSINRLIKRNLKHTIKESNFDTFLQWNT